MNTKELQEILEEAKTTKILDLSDENLSVTNIKDIIAALPSINGLLAINLSGIRNFITPEIAESFFYSIKKCCHLRYLDLSFCKLGDQYIRLLTDAIQNHSSLLSLELGSNDISQESALAITKALGTTEVLSLNLSENKIGISAGKEIAIAVENNRKLLLLNLFSSALNALPMDRDTSVQIQTKIESNLKQFSVLFEEESAHLIPEISETLLEYLESQMPLQSSKPLQLRDNPLIFLGKWQTSRRSTASKDQCENALLITLLLYERHKKSSDSRNHDTNTKENFSPNTSKKRSPFDSTD